MPFFHFIFLPGIEKQLYVELIQQYQACKKLSKDFTGQQSVLNSVKDYICGSSNHPLIIHGPTGCGKSSLIAKVAEMSSTWLPAACVVPRLISLTAESSTQQQLLRSISEQCCALYGEHPSVASSVSFFFFFALFTWYFYILRSSH